MKHPDLAFVESVVKEVLDKRRFSDWKFKQTTYAHFPSRYDVFFTNQKEEKKVSLVTEFFDDIKNNDTPFTRRKIKKLIKKELLPFDMNEDD